ncbi:MAG: 23S rRNA (guanosine(2251)-2'-O)-methyltransferase RlmB [Oscillospiraceae bacterium]|nr:23S rRNA (guanosine(2251)-2'-O)-methyltransferase RlmB [Oscillospiraceae bacterium]
MRINDENSKKVSADLESGIIYGRNAVVELLKSESPVDTVFIDKEMQENVASYYIALANTKKAIVKRLPAIKLDNICGDRHHQGIAASASFCDYCTVDEIINFAAEKNEKPFIILTDGIEDPHNLGAIIRTAECAGAHGVIIPKRGNVAVNATVHRASAGASSHIKIARVSNLANEIRYLKKAGIFFYCADMDGICCYKSDLSGSIGLVIGSEGFGVSRLVKELCDGTISLPMYGNINSLNASAAASALIYEIIRQRNFKE